MYLQRPYSSKIKTIWDLVLETIQERFFLFQYSRTIITVPNNYNDNIIVNFLFMFRKLIQPGYEVTNVVKLRPTRLSHRNRKLVANFTSDQIVNVHAVKKIQILKQNDSDSDDSDDGIFSDWF